MSRQLCGICMCPYDEQDGSCGCTEVNQECNSSQVKELTDEEIEDIRSNEWLSFAVKQKSNGIKPSTGAAWEHWLAKAILRKAQEK